MLRVDEGPPLPVLVGIASTHGAKADGVSHVLTASHQEKRTDREEHPLALPIGDHPLPLVQPDQRCLSFLSLCMSHGAPPPAAGKYLLSSHATTAQSHGLTVPERSYLRLASQVSLLRPLLC